MTGIYLLWLARGNFVFLNIPPMRLFNTYCLLWVIGAAWASSAFGQSYLTQPTITQQLQPRVTLVAGNYYTLAMYVWYTGTAYSATWSKDGVTLTDASRMSFPGNGAYYYFSPAAYSDAGTYTVALRGSSITVTSQPSYVTVVAPLTVTVPTPANVIPTGGGVTLQAVTTGGGTPLSYQWANNLGPISGATGSSLTLTNLQYSADYYVTVADSVQSVKSGWTLVTVGNPPAITIQPTGVVANAGQPITLAVSATGTGTLLYQWYKNGNAIAGATGAVLALSNVSADDAANYYVVVSSSFGSVTSNAVALNVNLSPVFTMQPADIAAPLGGSVTLTAAASGPPAPTYQWYKNGQPIAGAIASTLTLNNLLPSTDAMYSVSATNSVGSATSNAVHVTVIIPTRAVNLSTLARADTGSNALIAGFVLSGTGNKLVLIRAVGPALAGFGVAGTEPDPTLSIVNSAGQTVAANDDWSTSSNLTDLAAATVAVGAFPLPQPSKDASLLTSLPAGAYTAVVGFNGTTPGNALVEVYEADGPTPVHLSNLSSRATISAATTSITTGLVVSGPSTKKFMLRAVGPTLGSFGVPGSLNDPKLALMDANGNVIASNDDWQTGAGASDVAAAIASTGAFSLPAGSKDSALVVTLPPGSYTALTQASDGGYGTVLVEIYEVP